MSLAVAHPQVYVLIKKNISWIISVCVYGNTESGCVGPLFMHRICILSEHKFT